MNELIEIPQKWAFNHEAQKMHDGLGIDEARFDKMISETRHAELDSEDQLQMLENALSRVKPTTVAELIAVGYIAGQIATEQRRRQQDPMQMLARLLK